MLVIGSRAIRFHVPEFREPRDWDLVGTGAEIEFLASRLPRVEEAAAQGSATKANFRYEGRLVEVADADKSHYWRKVLETFADAPTLRNEVFGELLVPSLSYLLLTKHCGLIYNVAHWHKNLEDLYALRPLVTEVTPEVAALLEYTLADSARMFAANHARRRSWIRTCHPDLPPVLDRDLHERLHELLKFGERPLCQGAGAWQGFPEVAPHERGDLMRQLFAEEALVLAAETYLQLDPEGELRTPRTRLRWALRQLAIGQLPPGLRYFVVNYYREILALIPDDWELRLLGSGLERRTVNGACSLEATPHCDELSAETFDCGLEGLVRVQEPCLGVAPGETCAGRLG